MKTGFVSVTSAKIVAGYSNDSPEFLSKQVYEDTDKTRAGALALIKRLSTANGNMFANAHGNFTLTVAK
jgi:hypothetical protein